MKAIAKKILFFTVTMLFIGMTSQFVQAVLPLTPSEPTLLWTQFKTQTMIASSIDGTSPPKTYKPRAHNTILIAVAVDPVSGRTCFTGTHTLNTIVRGGIWCRNNAGVWVNIFIKQGVRPFHIVIDSYNRKIYVTNLGVISTGILSFDYNPDIPPTALGNPQVFVDIFAERRKIFQNTGLTHGRGINQTLEFSQASGFALVNDYIYWTDSFAGDMHRRSLLGGAIERVSSNTPDAKTMTYCNGKIYWVSTESLWRANISVSGISGIVEINTGFDSLRGLDTDCNFLYTADMGNGKIEKMTLGGGSRTVLHNLQFEKKPGKWKNREPFSIAVYNPQGTPVQGTPYPTPTPAPAPAPTAPAPAESLFAPPGRVNVSYKDGRGKGIWNISVAPSPGLATRYNIYIKDSKGMVVLLLSNQSTNIAVAAKIKGMTRASQRLIPTGPLWVYTETARGTKGPLYGVRMK